MVCCLIIAAVTVIQYLHFLRHNRVLFVLLPVLMVVMEAVPSTSTICIVNEECSPMNRLRAPILSEAYLYIFASLHARKADGQPSGIAAVLHAL